MNSPWSKTVFPIASIFSFRMLGLFMLIPVFTTYATSLSQASPALIGLALGSYGLTQGLLQIPFGMLSDKFGRKNIISLGLILFAIGSLIGACTESIYGMILARIIQGMGAIGSVLIALLADLTPDTQRTKAMAVIGMSIGISFMLAMVFSPVLVANFGLSSIFYLTCLLALSGLIILYKIIPNPDKEQFHVESETDPSLLKTVLKDPQLLILDLGIFCQHFILTSTFFSIPLILKEQIKIGHLSQQWHFYLPIILISFCAMLPFIIWSEKKKKTKALFLLSVTILVSTQFLLAFNYLHMHSLFLLMLFYFFAFNLLEASLPSQVSKLVSPNRRGTAMGVYSTAQFLGIFAGGTCAGFIYFWSGHPGIFMLNTLVGIIWLVWTCFSKL